MPLFPLHRPELRELLESGDKTLFDTMGPSQLRDRGERLVREGEPSHAVYRIHSGWATRSRQLSGGKRQIIAIFLPGDLAGIKSLLLERQPDSVECVSVIEVQAIDVAALSRLAETHYAVGLRIMFQLGEDERRLLNWVAALAKASAEERLANMLLDLRGRLHRLGLVKDDRFRFHLTQQQIGDFAGLTVVHVNRTLRRLRDAGLVSISKGIVTIMNPAGLGELAAAVQDVFERETPEFSGGKLQ